MRPRQRKAKKTKNSGSTVQYAVDEGDGETDSEETDESTSSESDDEGKKKPSKPAGLSPVNPESDGDSSSTNDLSDSYYKPKSTYLPARANAKKSSVCESCGRGPFRSLKLHLRHCTGVRVKYKCFLCKGLFVTQKLLNEHYMSLYSCDTCGQVFSNEVVYFDHPCPKKKGKAPLSLFCSEAMPQVCNLCKSFFTTEKALFNHVTKVHTSVVSTKVCIIKNPSMVTNKDVPEAHSALSYPEKTPNSSASNPDSPESPTILAMFENDSHDVALMKRMNTSWRCKAPHPCRQCGAIFRQPSLIISHRYLHRGHRSHQCQCGRAFKHQLHLLRHCVQHAENMSYICVGCGGTFMGATVLAKHLKGTSGCKPKRQVKQKCRTPFTCDCGQLFFRPSAYIWHQLKNRTKTNCVKKRLKWWSSDTESASFVVFSLSSSTVCTSTKLKKGIIYTVSPSDKNSHIQSQWLLLQACSGWLLIFFFFFFVKMCKWYTANKVKTSSSFDKILFIYKPHMAVLIYFSDYTQTKQTNKQKAPVYPPERSKSSFAHLRFLTKCFF